MFLKLRMWFLKKLSPTWVVLLPHGDEAGGDFGIKIMGIVLTHYKDHTPLFYGDVPCRPVNKREFGEVIRAAEIKDPTPPPVEGSCYIEKQDTWSDRKW
jgi:hypothetical protein